MLDFEGAIVIKKIMRFRLLRNYLTYVILLLYICIPTLDSMVCADCIGTAPFRGEAAISHMKTAHVDVSYSSKGEKQADTATERGHKSICSICANVLMGTEVSSSNLHIIVAQCDNPLVLPAISELHYSIDKPPQNSLV